MKIFVLRQEKKKRHPKTTVKSITLQIKKIPKLYLNHAAFIEARSFLYKLTSSQSYCGTYIEEHTRKF